MKNYEKAYRDRQRGMSYKEIAAKYNVSINTVKSWKTRQWADIDAECAHKDTHTCTPEQAARAIQTQAEKAQRDHTRKAREDSQIIKATQERLARYEDHQKLMEETGVSQLSLTDADARLMKSRNGFAVAYNPQTAVGSATHLIRDFKMGNQVTDHGMLSPTMQGIRRENPEGILEVTADKGYVNEEDMVKCLEEGIVPHVMMEDGKEGYKLEIPYEETETDTHSTRPEELKKCIHAGKVPEAYKDVISDMKVEEVRRKVKDEIEEAEVAASVYRTPVEMQERAKEGYFVRDSERNLVYCPAGETLRQKCIKKNGNIRYANKNACRHCENRNKCYKGKGGWKEIDFTKDSLEKPCKEWLKAEGKSQKSPRIR